DAAGEDRDAETERLEEQWIHLWDLDLRERLDVASDRVDRIAERLRRGRTLRRRDLGFVGALFGGHGERSHSLDPCVRRGDRVPDVPLDVADMLERRGVHALVFHIRGACESLSRLLEACRPRWPRV